MVLVKALRKALRSCALYILFACAIGLNTTWFFRRRFHVVQHVPKPRPMSYEDAFKDPIVMAMMVMSEPSGQGQGHLNVVGCSWEGHPIGCHVTNAEAQTYADVLLYEASSTPCPLGQRKSWPWQLRVIWSTESSEYHPVLEKRACMDDYDIEMTYRTCSKVLASSFKYTPQTLSTKFFQPPLPFEAKKNLAIVFLDEDCTTLSKREEVLRDIIGNGVRIDAWGKCLSGIKGHRNQTVLERSKLYREYKFCIALETSLAQDYVTEDLWLALEAGCVPLYLGAPNIKDFLPAPESIINLSDFEARKSVANILKKLSKNSTAYLSHLAWKKQPLTKLSQGFQKMVLASQAADSQSNECKLCQLAMTQRVATVPPKYSHCLRNNSWLRAQRTHSSSWGPGKVTGLLQNVRWPPVGHKQWSAKDGLP